ncbi:TonB-dependent receptor [Paraferrimonas sp. SM1919]|uniref:TonB-dependent receptor n=1 Tax=Paraferrimonas sp. SM1919 TaxID=2662263 RepID=UPI0013D81040|nr:TonB-dependent receptor [Paraferrimonas sp. SM1919]
MLKVKSYLAACISLGVIGNAYAEIEKITVTATKRAQAEQEVPISISVVTDEQIERLGLTDAFDLTKMVPGFNANQAQTDGESEIRIRGIGSNQSNVGIEPSTSVMIDGETLAKTDAVYSSLVDVARVEILRGPQGTLLGKNSASGVVHIITKRPDSENYKGYIKADFDSQGQKMLRFGHTGPINEDFAYRFNLMGAENDGYIENLQPENGKNGRWNQRFGVGGQLQWFVDDNSDLLLRLTKQTKTSNGSPPIALPGDGTQSQPWWDERYQQHQQKSDGNIEYMRHMFGGLDSYMQLKGAAFDVDNYKQNEYGQRLRLYRTGEARDGVADSYSRKAYNETMKDNVAAAFDGSLESNIDTFGVNLEYTRSMGEYELVALAAYRDWQSEGNKDYDNSPFATGTDQYYSLVQTTTKQFDLRVVSPEFDNYDYVAGAFYYHNLNDQEARLNMCTNNLERVGGKAFYHDSKYANEYEMYNEEFGTNIDSLDDVPLWTPGIDNNFTVTDCAHTHESNNTAMNAGTQPIWNHRNWFANPLVNENVAVALDQASAPDVLYFDPTSPSTEFIGKDFYAARETKYQVESENMALYGQFNFHPTEDLTFYFGGRLLKDSTNMYTKSAGNSYLGNLQNGEQLNSKVFSDWYLEQHLAYQNSIKENPDLPDNLRPGFEIQGELYDYDSRYIAPEGGSKASSADTMTGFHLDSLYVIDGRNIDVFDPLLPQGNPNASVNREEWQRYLEQFKQPQTMDGVHVSQHLMDRGVEYISPTLSDTHFMYKTGLTWDFAENKMLYVAYSTGYKGYAWGASGSIAPYEVFNTPEKNIANGVIREALYALPEKSKASEIGIKTMLFENHVLFNFNLFHTDFENFQEMTRFPDPDSSTGLTGSRLFNIPSVISRGAELQWAVSVMDNFEIAGSAAYVDAFYNSEVYTGCSDSRGQEAMRDWYQTLSGGGLSLEQAMEKSGCHHLDLNNDGLYDLDGNGRALNAVPLKGRQMRGTPKWQYNISARYDTSFGNHYRLNLNSFWRWQDEVQYDLKQSPDTLHPSYGILDLGASIRHTKQRWSASLRIKNVLDTLYFSNLRTQNASWMPGVNGSLPYDHERMYSVQLNYEF